MKLITLKIMLMASRKGVQRLDLGAYTQDQKTVWGVDG